MVLIPPGEFLMGSTQAELVRFLEEAKAFGNQKAMIVVSSEGPQHRVRITKPFWLSRYEVTRGQFRQFVEETGYKTEAERSVNGGVGYVDGMLQQAPRFIWSADPGFSQQETHPVVTVSWNDALAFCRWLSNRQRGVTFALPTEAQWEYACRAGTTTLWHGGDDEEKLGKYCWSRANSGGGTHPVGQLTPNAFGLYDMHGNVWERCTDWFAADYYANSPANDPTGPSIGLRHLIRGASWQESATTGRSASRHRSYKNWPTCHIGFRVAAVFEVAERGAVEVRADEAIADQIEVVFRKRGQTVEVLKQGRFTAQLQEGVYDVELKSAQASAPLKHDRVVVRTDQVTLIEITLQKRLGPIERTGQPLLATLKGHAAGITRLDYAPNRKLLASSSSDGIIKLWDVETGDLVDTLFGSQGMVQRIDFSPDGKTIATTGRQHKSVDIWNSETGELVLSLECGDRFLHQFAFSPDGKSLAASIESHTADGKPSGGYLVLWDLKTGKERWLLFADPRRVASLDFSPDGKTLVTGNADHHVYLRSIETGTPVADLGSHASWVGPASYSPSGDLIASASVDVMVWDVATRRRVGTVKGDPRIGDVLFLDSLTLASWWWNKDNDIRLWDVQALINGEAPSGGAAQVAPIPFGPGRDQPQVIPIARPSRSEIAETQLQHAISSKDLGNLIWQAEKFEEEQQYDDAFRALDAAIQVSPDNRTLEYLRRWSDAQMVQSRAKNWQLRFWRAHLNVALGDWYAALNDMQATGRFKPEDAEDWLKTGALYLMVGEEHEYKQFCETIFKTNGESDDPIIKEAVAGLCLIGPSGIDPRQLRASVQQAAAAWPADADRAWVDTTIALAHYREGAFDGALKQTTALTESAVSGKAVEPDVNLQAQLVRAMSLAKLGRNEEAQALYEGAAKEIESLLKPDPAGQEQPMARPVIA